jgi:hypothetical protein
MCYYKSEEYNPFPESLKQHFNKLISMIKFKRGDRVFDLDWKNNVCSGTIEGVKLTFDNFEPPTTSNEILYLFVSTQRDQIWVPSSRLYPFDSEKNRRIEIFQGLLKFKKKRVKKIKKKISRILKGEMI